MRIPRLTATLLAALRSRAARRTRSPAATSSRWSPRARRSRSAQQYYPPSRQSQGGDYVTDPRVTEYVRQVGNRLAAVADRRLPYEFVVLNSGELNAWALPGGKIAVNRGLLAELKNEAELAAVLGHEIVHAAARHGAQQMEKGQLLQIGAAVAPIGAAAYGGSDLGAGGRPGRSARRTVAAGQVRPRRRTGVRPVRHEVHEASSATTCRRRSPCRNCSSASTRPESSRTG